MDKTKFRLLAVLLVIVLLAFPSAVFAKELGLLKISGPGIKGVLTLTGPDQWGKLEDTGYFAPENFIKQAPENLDLELGYTLTPHLNVDGKLLPFIEMVYYPTEEGKPGYFHVTGRLDGETLRPVNEWGMSTLQADKAFRALMIANNVAVQSAMIAAAPQSQPEAQPASTSPTPAAPTWVLYPALALIAALAAALILRRRAAKQQSA